LFLSKGERDYLLSSTSLQISDGYSRVIRSRLQKKKIERFASEELPLLIEKALLLPSSTILDANSSGVAKFRNGSVTENCNNAEGRASLIRYRRHHQRMIRLLRREKITEEEQLPPRRQLRLSEFQGSSR
jgi:hypothetical protein